MGENEEEVRGSEEREARSEATAGLRAISAITNNASSTRRFAPHRSLDGVREYLLDNSNVEIPPSVQAKYELARSLLESAHEKRESRSYDEYSVMTDMAMELVR